MQKGFVPILIIILLAAATLGGYLIYQSKSTPSPQPPPTPDKNASWKIYMNELVGFKFQYPVEWSFTTKETTNQNYPRITIQSPDYQEKINGFTTVLSGTKITINVNKPNESFKTLNDYVPFYATNITNISINEEPAIQFDYLYESQNATETTFLHDGLYSIAITIIYPNKAQWRSINWETYKQILFTFKFLDSTPQSSPTAKNIVEKTLINTNNSGKYTNEEYGYTVEFPKEWELYTYYSNRSGNMLQLSHSKCNGKDFILPEERIPCTNVALPYYEGSTGWGYGNKKQTEETVAVKNNTKADKTTFYYDDYTMISWTFNINIPDKCKELGISSLVAFANINESFAPGSTQAVDSIIKSLDFTSLKDTACQ